MIELGFVLLVGALVCTAAVVLFAVLKALLWLVLLPLRLLMWTLGALLFVPILLAKLLFGGLLFVLAIPFLAIGLVVFTLLAVLATFLLPLLPFALLFFVLWYLLRSNPQPAMPVQ